MKENELVVKGRQEFMGREIPVVLGGFGEGKKCVSDKTIAEIHGMREPDVRRRITDNIKRFKESIDFIDIKQRILLTDTLGVHETHTLELLQNLGYAKQSITQAEHIYILSERGYAKLIKIMDTDLAWDIHDRLMDEYFQLREERKSLENLSPQLQFLINVELEQKRQAEKLEEVDRKVDSIKEVIALRPNAWRKDTGVIINKIAYSLGGAEHIRAVREESYKILEERMHVALGIRLTNKKKTYAMNGVCKSKIDKLNQLDVIADDPKLIEGYIAIIKEMAVKYGVSLEERR
ncbi:ORF6N domain-containing protein [Muricomes sp. OA1]|uniref:ORF6N domain-containing protein n=1 Tax=Muricomes sp. OA1 TaxID=2914165 RepID=UPI001F05CE91|nr:ORF6N domain-containing protein [Muricomes sp. OA1]MCH1974724.1 ORF6N domain-containing protein [Muricomes sp. OA1]